MATTAAAPGPNLINWMTRARMPLIALTVALVALDAIGLGLRWADSTNQAIGDITPRVLRPRVGGPDAVVSGSGASSGSSSGSARRRSGSTSIGGGFGNGVLVGPVAPPIARPTPGPTSPTPSPKPAPSPAVPLAQIDASVPGVAQASVGAGDNSCTTVGLTLLAPGNCPTPPGDGPVVLQVGGSLLGK